MRILMIGDLVGRGARRAVRMLVPQIRHERRVDFVVANGENAAGGRGLTPATASEIFAAGVDVITSGNHIWDQREVIPYLDSEPRVLRPLNYPPGVPGHGHVMYRDVLVVNLSGRVFLGNFDCPFRTADRLLAELEGRPRAIVVDFHAEATSEKVLSGWYFDGRVTAVVGTHTHVPTCDTRVLPKGTAHVSDLGMVGPLNSVLGVEPERVKAHLTTLMPARFKIADGPIVFNSVLVELDETTGRAVAIERLDRIVEVDKFMEDNDD
ncbi:MAG: TIGR00282 family metallophosphoesterase [Dehalococcoidales bacterium]|nr:TIGR00282 family metallophosphoesterase [Dehalococcoidales bacterium]